MSDFVVEAKGPVQVDIQDASDLSLSDMLEIVAGGGNGVEYININNLMEKAATRIRELEAQLAAAEPLAYAPGLWRCPKCNFRLVQSNLNTGDGSVTARNEPGDKCPNCNGPLWRVSWKQDAMENMDLVEKLSGEKAAAEAAGFEKGIEMAAVAALKKSTQTPENLGNAADSWQAALSELADEIRATIGATRE